MTEALGSLLKPRRTCCVENGGVVDEVRSFRWGVAARFNRDVVQGTDLFSLTANNSTGEQLGIQAAWVHDDTVVLDSTFDMVFEPGSGVNTSSMAWERRPLPMNRVDSQLLITVVLWYDWI